MERSKIIQPDGLGTHLADGVAHVSPVAMSGICNVA